MNPYLDSSARHQASKAAQIAIVLKQLGKLRSYSQVDLETALAILRQRQESELTLTSELLRGIHKRTGQMIALEPAMEPLAGFSANQRQTAA